MWNPFKKREEGDLRKLISAYRCLLRAGQQAESQPLLDEAERRARRWKGGFGKAFRQLFQEWPTPNQSRRFERMMRRWLKKADSDIERAFVQAFNEYLGQKRLTNGEIQDVMKEAREGLQA